MAAPTLIPRTTGSAADLAKARKQTKTAALPERLRDGSTDAYTAGDKIYTAVLPPSTGRIAP
jgi:hypothetical protein